MGAWEVGTLSNDDAQEFLESLGEAKKRWKLVIAALEGPAVDSADASAALAAAEVLAAARGHEDAEFPVELSVWVSKSKIPLDIEALSKKAQEAVERVRAGSELRDLHAEAGRLEQWFTALDNLNARLAEERRRPVRPKRVRPRPGDVFQVALPTGQYAYLRLSEDPWVFWMYDYISEVPAQPPIGLRKFRFTQVGMWEELRSGFCPRVGSDPFDPDDPNRDPVFFRQVYPWNCVEYAQSKVGFGQLTRFRAGAHGSLRFAEVSECIGLPKYQDGGYRIDSVVTRFLEGEDGPTARECWPILCDGTGALHHMRWEDWQPEWLAKMPTTGQDHHPKRLAAAIELDDFEKAFWSTRAELRVQITEFDRKYGDVLKKYRGKLPEYGSEDEVRMNAKVVPTSS
jgi:hypothetical protein